MKKVNKKGYSDQAYDKMGQYVLRYSKQNANAKLKIADFQAWINKHLKHYLNRPYYGFRCVPKAIWDRSNYEVKEALEYTLTDKNGKFLL